MNLLTIAAIVGGLYLYNQSQSKPKTVIQKVTFDYTCSSIVIKENYNLFLKSLNAKIIKLFFNQNITKDNVMILTDSQIIDLSKYWIYELNPSCYKDVNIMSNDEKILVLMLFTILSVKLIQLKQNIDLNTDYVIDDGNVSNYQQIIIGYTNVLQKYLQTNYSVEQITQFNNQLKNNKQFP